MSSYGRLASVTTPDRILPSRSNALRCASMIAIFLPEMIAKELKTEKGYNDSSDGHTTLYGLGKTVFEPPPSKEKELLAN